MIGAIQEISSLLKKGQTLHAEDVLGMLAVLTDRLVAHFEAECDDYRCRWKRTR